MTIDHGVITPSGERLRAKDVVMAATVDTRLRRIMLTGAIDTNDHDILVHVEVPDAGAWTMVKSETNLTDEAWEAWQITLGDGASIDASDHEAAAAQYAKVHIASEGNRFTFYGGEVRPGEAVLKTFKLQLSQPLVTMSHSRVTRLPDEEDEQDVAVAVGFSVKPVIEVFVPTRIVS